MLQRQETTNGERVAIGPLPFLLHCTFFNSESQISPLTTLIAFCSFRKIFSKFIKHFSFSEATASCRGLQTSVSYRGSNVTQEEAAAPTRPKQSKIHIIQLQLWAERCKAHFHLCKLMFGKRALYALLSAICHAIVFGKWESTS